MSALSCLLTSWSAVLEYLIFLGVATAGLLQASLMWIVIAAMALFLLSWPRWRNLIAKAGRIDHHRRLLGARAFLLPLVLGAKFGQDGLFLALAYGVGVAAKWLWFDGLLAH